MLAPARRDAPSLQARGSSIFLKLAATEVTGTRKVSFI